MKSRIIIVVMSALAGVLAAKVILMQREIAALKKDLAKRPAIERPVEAAPVPAPAPRAEVVAEKPAPPAPVVQPPPPPVAPVAPAAVAGQKPKPNMSDFMKGIGSMMTNSAMKEMIRQQAKMQLEMQYGRLFKFLNKSPEQIEALKNLLMDRQMALMDSGIAMMSGDMSTEERTKKGQEIKAAKDSYDKKIAELLGPDDYDAFKQYENTQSERMQVEMFKSRLASAGEPLTEQQEYDLVNAMYSARTNMPAVSAMMNQETPPDPAMFSSSGITNMFAQMDKVQESYAKAAAAILTPSQNEQFKKHAEQQKAMQEMGMKFAAQMFGGSSNAVPANVQIQVQTAP